MSGWDNLFDFDPTTRHNRQIRELQNEVNSVPDHSRALGEIQKRLDRAELLNRSLIELLMAKNILTEQELGVMVQQVDLLDGVEDGKISAHVHANALCCGHCGRYANPKRSECVYCGHALKFSAKEKRSTPARSVKCVSCGSVVPERSSYFGEQGVVCEGCFSG